MSCVKVVYGTERLVIPRGKQGDRVRSLLEQIRTRLRALTGKSAEELQIVGLTTAVWINHNFIKLLLYQSSVGDRDATFLCALSSFPILS
jgi:hypothetical protein